MKLQTLKPTVALMNYLDALDAAGFLYDFDCTMYTVFEARDAFVTMIQIPGGDFQVGVFKKPTLSTEATFEPMPRYEDDNYLEAQQYFAVTCLDVLGISPAFKR